jgi:hypothetical protein
VTLVALANHSSLSSTSRLISASSSGAGKKLLFRLAQRAAPQKSPPAGSRQPDGRRAAVRPPVRLKAVIAILRLQFFDVPFGALESLPGPAPKFPAAALTE